MARSTTRQSARSKSRHRYYPKPLSPAEYDASIRAIRENAGLLEEADAIALGYVVLDPEDPGLAAPDGPTRSAR